MTSSPWVPMDPVDPSSVTVRCQSPDAGRRGPDDTARPFTGADADSCSVENPSDTQPTLAALLVAIHIGGVGLRLVDIVSVVIQRGEGEIRNIEIDFRE